MKKLLFCICSVFLIEAIFMQSLSAQIMLQKAVISNGGGIATNGTVTGEFIAGQTAVGTASNSQMTGQFGFFAAPNSINSVTTQRAGAISSLQLMPNPASDNITININLASSESIDLLLYDASGHFITTIYSGQKSAGLFSQNFNVKNLASGIYYIAARIPGALLQTKLNVVK